jgi:hypothetical protein
LDLLNLQLALQQYLEEPNRASFIRVHHASHARKAFIEASPVRDAWYKHPQQRWFAALIADMRLKAIVAALRRYPEALHEQIVRRGALEVFLPPLERLLAFYALTIEPPDRAVASEKQLQRLTEFARLCRPALTAALQSRKRQRQPGEVRRRWGEIRRHPLVRTAGTISATAGVVMVIGVLIFRIRPDQAFLTWFTVTFGSLTVSVGITSFRLARDETNRRSRGAG